jgi:hypothetical protein
VSAAPSFESAFDRHLSSRRRAPLQAGAVMLAVSIIAALFYPGEFFRSYLFAYLFFLGLSLGSMALVMTYHLTGGAWGVMSRRTFESATRTLPLLVLLFIPIAAGIPYLYPWAHADLIRADPVLRHRMPYMTAPLFLVRAAVYFAAWLIFAHFLNKWSREEDNGAARQRHFSRLSAPGLIVYVFSVTFAAVDWAESLTVHWYSTMWGFLFVAAQGLAALSFGICVLTMLSRRAPMSRALRPAHFHDLGKLELMFVMLWAYFAFSQWLIVWSGNLTAEIPWYISRLHTSWGWVAGALLLLQFTIPFLLLLSRRLKRVPWALFFVAILILVMRMVDLFWIVMPGFYGGFRVHWLNFLVPAGLAGLWIGEYLRQLGKRPLLPLGDPLLERALHHGEH